MAGASVDGLTPSQEKAIIALLAEPSLSRAAQACGVGERTLYRWLREGPFKTAYRTARREAFSHAIALTQRYAPLAVQTLAKVMADDNAPHTARVQAATAMLRFGRDGIELDDLQERLEALEAQMAPAEEQRRSAA
jgi:hypothetical protein